jgi:large subunit ribosomal protein L6
MSKIGKKPIIIPEGVQVTADSGIVKVKGPKGESELPLHPKIQVSLLDKTLKVSVKKPEDRRQKALWGTYRSLLASLISGVISGFEKKLEVIGVGYKANLEGEKLVLSLGFSHPIIIRIPKGLAVKIEKNVISISGINKQEVGEFAACIRSHRPPEPYKGKGIRYVGESVRRKPGKVVKAVGA